MDDIWHEDILTLQGGRSRRHWAKASHRIKSLMYGPVKLNTRTNSFKNRILMTSKIDVAGITQISALLLYVRYLYYYFKETNVLGIYFQGENWKKMYDDYQITCKVFPRPMQCARMQPEPLSFLIRFTLSKHASHINLIPFAWIKTNIL